MSKFLIINICLVVAYVAPMIITEQLTYTCKVGNLNEARPTTWSYTNKSIKVASLNAQSLCEKKSKTPEKCLIISCDKNFFN